MMNYQKKFSLESRRIFFMTMAVSMLLAWVGANTGIGHLLRVEFSVSIPVAQLLDRASGTRYHTFYFVGMIAYFPLLVFWYAKALHVAVRRNALGKPLMALVLAAASAGSFWLCVLVPSDYKLGGGRFSLLVTSAAKFWVVLGAAYGILFMASAAFAAISFLALKQIMHGGDHNDYE